MAGSAEDPDSEATATSGAIQRRLTDLGQKLDQTKARREARNFRPERRSSAMVLAIRAVSELVAAVLVGGVIGWGLDWWLGTSPVLLLIFFLFGFAAGVVNVVRATQQTKAGLAETEDGNN